MLYDKRFFAMPTEKVARALVGQGITFDIDGQMSHGRIVETEAYFAEDPATHGHRGKTPARAAMFLEAGHLYLHLIYGMHVCLNLVTEREGYASAVLLRGVRFFFPEEMYCDGPGKICRHLGLGVARNGENFLESGILRIESQPYQAQLAVATRVGIRKNAEALLRFYDANEKVPHLNKRPRG